MYGKRIRCILNQQKTSADGCHVISISIVLRKDDNIYKLTEEDFGMLYEIKIEISEIFL